MIRRVDEEFEYVRVLIRIGSPNRRRKRTEILAVLVLSVRSWTSSVGGTIIGPLILMNLLRPPLLYYHLKLFIYLFLVYCLSPEGACRLQTPPQYKGDRTRPPSRYVI